MLIRLAIVCGLLLWPSSGTVEKSNEMQSDANIHGRVFDSGYGTLVGGARLSFRDGPLELTAVTESDGQYSLERIPAGHYTVTVTCPGFATRSLQVDLKPEAQELNFPIGVGIHGLSSVGFLLEGSVTDSANKPLEGAIVVMESPFDRTVTEGVTTQAGGRYVIRVPRPGQYVLYASKEGFRALAKVVSADGERTRTNFILPAFHF